MSSASTLRAVASIVAARRGTMLTRVIGTLDCRGAGTEHAVADVNPFVLMDDAAEMRRRHVPPFGMHPHAHLCVASLVLRGSLEYQLGSQLRDDDERPGDEGRVSILGPGPFVAVASAGRGLAHLERTASDEPTKMMQVIWRAPLSAVDDAPRMVERVPPAFVELDDGRATAMLACGSLGDVDAGVDMPHRVLLAHVELRAGARVHVPTRRGDGGFVYVYEGGGGGGADDDTNKSDDKQPPPPPHVFVSERACRDAELAILGDCDDDAGAVLLLEHRGDAGAPPARVVVGVGARIDEPWVKLLTHNGFVLARDKAAALAKEAEFVAAGLRRFGVRDEQE